ncbi:myb-like protein X [Salvia splendens]|uniref:myb-like protein X n=1 Tax=Salvia splendens TaxID=180675 RepID=UPI001C2673EB|nr:myb-like protein X [Salvia splendens]XP_042050773.1 myb-like protein X [Salvia splendens]XP_042050774.1 myb-like protein X [Salvia splendens]
MSRCFPFPPPGYERKHIPDDLDLLKEAKHKEKKHKKEKKDKEIKKDKERDGSDEKKHRDKKDRKEKHKEKKEKKEKHKDKRKDKEGCGKDKDKSSISEESTVAEKLEDRSGGKLQPKVHNKDRSGFGNEARSSSPFQGQDGGKPSQSFLSSQFNEESKFVQELDRRIRDDQRSGGSQLPERVAVLDNKDQEMVSRGAIRNSSGLLVAEKGDNKNKRTERQSDPQGVKNEFGGSKMMQSLIPNPKAKVEGVPKTVDEQNGRRWEEREKFKETGVVKQKDRVKEIPLKENDKDKEKKKEENAKIRKGDKNSSQCLFKNDGSNDPSSISGKHSVDLLKETYSNAGNEGNFRKRKDENTNGFLHESDIRPNKMQRLAPHQLTENGRKLDPFETPMKPSHNNHIIPNNARVDNRERLMNGFTGAHKPSPQKPKSSAVVAVVSNQITEASKVPGHDPPSVYKALKVPKIDDLIAEASRRPPHPDSKYLAEVLTVPKVEDWSEPDHQDWLFTEKGRAGMRKVEPVRDRDDQHVWSEAVHIESADICALPYVIPY